MQFIASTNDTRLKEDVVKNLGATRDKLIQQGLTEFIVDDFWDNLMEQVRVSVFVTPSMHLNSGVLNVATCTFIFRLLSCSRL